MSKTEPKPTTVYTVKGKTKDTVWEFKYNLNGVLEEFKILDDLTLEQNQINWLKKNFPYFESDIIKWKETIKNIEVIIGTPDLSFDTFWKMYNLKVGKIDTEKLWHKLTKAEQLKAIKQIKAYSGFLRRRGTAKMHPDRFLRKKHFNDQFNSIA